MNIFSEFFYAIFGVKKYPNFLKNKGGKAFLYLMFVVLIYTAIANAWLILGSKYFVSESKEFIKYDLPNFSVKNGHMEIEESIYYEIEQMYISIDSEYGSYINQYEKGEWMMMLADYEDALMLDETHLLFKNDTRLEIVEYASYWNFSKDDIYDIVDYTYGVIAIYLILAYICNILGYLLGTLIIALIGMLIDSFDGNGLTFGQLFKLSIYAKTLMLIVKALIKLLQVNFSGLFVLVIVISSLYLGFALRYMRHKNEQDKRYGDPIIF